MIVGSPVATPCSGHGSVRSQCLGEYGPLMAAARTQRNEEAALPLALVRRLLQDDTFQPGPRPHRLADLQGSVWIFKVRT